MKINIKIAVVITALVFLLFYLFVAIVRPIDGIGIFALCASIIFFSLMLLKTPKKLKPDKPDDDNGEGIDIVGRNAAGFIEYATSPKFLGLMFNMLLCILNHIERNLDRLTNEQLEKLVTHINNIINKISKISPEPTNTSPNVLKKKMNRSQDG